MSVEVSGYSFYYEVLKDFVGPTATFIAAVAAMLVTWHFNCVQTKIASSQRDIAFDKLKLDLFEKRYEIYSAAKSLIKLLLETSDYDKIDHMKIKELYVKLDESRFYFGIHIREFIHKIHELSEAYIADQEQRKNPETDRNQSSLETNEFSNDRAKLRDMGSQLPKTFESALAFTKLTAG